MKLAKSKGWEYYQTSANTGENVKDVSNGKVNVFVASKVIKDRCEVFLISKEKVFLKKLSLIIYQV